MSTSFKQILLLLGDWGLLYLSLFLALAVRFQKNPQPDLWAQHWPIFTFVFLAWLLIFYLNGLYDLRHAKNNFDFFSSFFISVSINLFLAIGFFYIISLPAMSPKTILLILTALFIPLFSLWRFLSHWLLQTKTFHTRLVFLGLTPEAIELIKTFFNNPQIGYDVPVVVAEESNQFLKELPKEIEILYSLDGLSGYLKIKKIDTIIVSYSKVEPQLERFLYETLLQRINIFNLDSFFEEITHRIPLTALSEGWFLNNLSRPQKRAFQIFKRGVDLLLALIMGIFFLFFFIPLALLIYINDRQTIFYKQTRVGRDGKIFNIYKFRTMVVGAESQGPKFTKIGDARVTRVGKILRLLRLDELPQAWNILKNEMSFIGPRPERPEFVAELQKMMPYYNVRHLIKPGLTGWAQVNYKYTDSLEENLIKLQYDLFYIKNQSLLIDFVTLIKTIKAVGGITGR